MKPSVIIKNKEAFDAWLAGRPIQFRPLTVAGDWSWTRVEPGTSISWLDDCEYRVVPATTAADIKPGEHFVWSGCKYLKIIKFAGRNAVRIDDTSWGSAGEAIFFTDDVVVERLEAHNG